MEVIPAIILIALVIAIYLLINTRDRNLTLSHRHFVKKQWKNITNDSSKNIYTAILNADKLLCRILELRGFTGSTGDQLKKSYGLFTSIDDVRSAHKVRNKIAHEIGFEINVREGKRVLNTYKQALNDLGGNL